MKNRTKVATQPKPSPKGEAKAQPSPSANKKSPSQEEKPYKPPPENVWRKILTRTLVGLLMIGFFAGVLMTEYVVIVLPVLAVVLQIFVYKEIVAVHYQMVKEKNLTLFRTINWFFLATTLFYFYAKPLATFLFLREAISRALYQQALHFHLWISFCLYILGFVGFVFSLQPGLYKYQFAQLAWTCLSLLIVVFQSASFIANFTHGIFWVVFPACMIICNDIAAYFWGICIGKKFVASSLTHLSPNKTWEGFIGALFTTVLISIPLCYFFMQYDRFVCPLWGFTDHCTRYPVWSPTEQELPFAEILEEFGIRTTYVFEPIYIHGVLLAIFASLIAPFGGFFASAMKRAHNVKDFNSIFPGHGGFYDRFDCQLLMVLCTFVHFRTFVQASVVDVPEILAHIELLSRTQQLQVLEYVRILVGQT